MVSNNENDLQNKAKDNTSACNLNCRIRHGEGYPIYITDDQWITSKLYIREIEYQNIFDINQLASDMKDLESWFMPTKTAKPSDSPVIFLLKNRSEAADEVMKIIKSANMTVYYQDANYPFTVINSNDKEEILKQIQASYNSNFSTASHIGKFRNVIESNANTPPIPTGFKELDSLLNGGLHEGLISVGAMTSLGKTTFCMQLADRIAESGHDVMIFSLEMSMNELIAKSISRITFEKIKAENKPISLAKTQVGITDGNRYQHYSDAEKELITESIETYQNNIAQHLYIHESVANMSVKEIGDIIDNHYERTYSHPVVIIDYLQLLQYKEDKYINGNDKLRTDINITSLKRLSRQYKIPIIAISSFNRTNYNKESNLSSFKESGGIEYSSDIIIGLDQTSIEQLSGANLTKRNIKLSIMKNRQGEKDKAIEYAYIPAFNYYEEIGRAKDKPKKQSFDD